MAAMLVEDADDPLRIAEGDKGVAEYFQRKRVAVRLGKIRRLQHRQPVAPQGLPHRRAGADAADQLVILPSEHAEILPVAFRLPRKMKS